MKRRKKWPLKERAEATIIPDRVMMTAVERGVPTTTTSSERKMIRSPSVKSHRKAMKTKRSRVKPLKLRKESRS